MEFEVRLATEADLDMVAATTVEAYRVDGYLHPDSDYVEHLADARARARDAELWVAADGTGVLGSVTFCSAGTAFAELARPGEAEFRMLSVAPHARRRGIAEALVRRCIERSGELGHQALVLCSMKEMVAAHRLYQRLGFVRDPERDWSPVQGVDLLAFRLPHPDSSA